MNMWRVKYSWHLTKILANVKLTRERNCYHSSLGYNCVGQTWLVYLCRDAQNYRYPNKDSSRWLIACVLPCNLFSLAFILNIYVTINVLVFLGLYIKLSSTAAYSACYRRRINLRYSSSKRWISNSRGQRANIKFSP